jgi:hypothetical protein
MALFTLSNSRLLNPVQFVVFLFHWYFAVGPSIHSLYSLVTGTADHSVYAYITGRTLSDSYYLQHGTRALMIVSVGLPLYSFVARRVLSWWPKAWYLKFLMPAGARYGPRTLVQWWGVAALAIGTIWLLGLAGVNAFTSINYLGGHVVENPLAALIASVTRIGELATVSAMGYVVLRRSPGATHFRILAAVILLCFSLNAMTSGVKGAVVEMSFYVLVSYITWRSKVPILAICCLAGAYLLVIEPVIAAGRLAAESAKVGTSADARQIFLDTLTNYEVSEKSWRDLNIESPFRFIFYCAGEVAESSALLTGPWAGATLKDGVSSILPRFLFPEKANSNMGNDFARSIGIAAPDDHATNASITMPFEIVGNYGWMAGVAAFALLGAVWSAFSAYVLSPARLATHPLSPFVVGMSVHFESSCGQFLGQYKDLVIIVPLLWLMWIINRRRWA